ncbi:MAG: acyl-CoA dehydrogenase family protein [Chloroflexi bacterium]|nr:acyl-CoA dehydrogenase family protein [Chloroflexota bacterium]
MSEVPLASRGGGFLVDDLAPDQMFTPEQFSEEQRAIGRTAEAFVEREVLPRLKALLAGDHALTVRLLRQAGELGLLGADMPAEYGGGGLGKVASTLITEKVAREASFGISFGTQTGIGTLPIVFFGSDEQKARFLPDLASGRKVGAYALTEPDAGSDAQGGKTVAHLTPDGRFYRLNGVKQWITNAGFADLFVLYAKVNGEQMTAFLVERSTEGVTIGPEWQKMGLQGSSTCNVYLGDVLVPRENVLGEVGQGHRIAFNILNIGRWKLAAGCLGACKAVLRLCARYAGQRRQFGHPISRFPAIQQKLAQMAARTFALESVVYRTASLFDQALQRLERPAPGHAVEATAQAMGEYAVEASINKVFGSEALDFVVDEGVQLHGGYGYMREFDMERAYRDARINRIFEGTNEINRLLIPGTLLRRATRGELPLLDAIQRVQRELASPSLPAPEAGAAGTSPLAPEAAQLANLKRATLMVAGLGTQKYLQRAEEEQEFLLAVADLAILTYAWESALLRARQALQRLPAHEAGPAVDLARLFGAWAMDEAELTARRALAGMERGDTLQVQLSLLRRLFRSAPRNTVELGRAIGMRVVAAGEYTPFAADVAREQQT